jgi:hypothetical protein
VSSTQDITRYISCTLLAALAPAQDFQAVVAGSCQAALGWLEQQRFIRWASGMMHAAAVGQ